MGVLELVEMVELVLRLFHQRLGVVHLALPILQLPGREILVSLGTLGYKQIGRLVAY